MSAAKNRRTAGAARQMHSRQSLSRSKAMFVVQRDHGVGGSWCFLVPLISCEAFGQDTKRRTMPRRAEVAMGRANDVKQIVLQIGENRSERYARGRQINATEGRVDSLRVRSSWHCTVQGRFPNSTLQRDRPGFEVGMQHLNFFTR